MTKETISANNQLYILFKILYANEVARNKFKGKLVEIVAL